MADPFIAEVRLLPFSFAPKGWAWCAGQIMRISQNTALFSLLGTVYGGDGKSTFALPNLQGSVPIGSGQGSGLSDRILGESGGSQTVTLLQSEMPVHTHALLAANETTDQSTPSPTVAWGRASMYGTPGQTLMSNQAVSVVGGDLPHNNLMPYMALNYAIALQGIFPPRP